MSVAILKKQVLIIKAEGTAKAQADEARITLKKHFGRKSWDTVRAALLPVFASAYGVKLVDGAGKAAGTKVLDSEAAAYEACRKTLGNTVKFITGGNASGKTEEFTKAQLKAAKQFLALFDSVAQAKACLVAE